MVISSPLLIFLKATTMVLCFMPAFGSQEWQRYLPKLLTGTGSINKLNVIGIVYIVLLVTVGPAIRTMNSPFLSDLLAKRALPLCFVCFTYTFVFKFLIWAGCR